MTAVKTFTEKQVCCSQPAPSHHVTLSCYWSLWLVSTFRWAGMIGQLLASERRKKVGRPEYDKDLAVHFRLMFVSNAELG